ncbi:hypothetical protein GGR53DRAFT_528924 [Hypoxylon sp. FL1150]|nr:hypothetical protein GGR53DRAFT_528924 [Hypoxylon sp. FL1150]
MKFYALLAFATAALALPADTESTKSTEVDTTVDTNVDIEFLRCSPATYICKPDFTGWLVCNVDGFFVDGGNCDTAAWCEYIDGLPYCIS